MDYTKKPAADTTDTKRKFDESLDHFFTWFSEDYDNESYDHLAEIFASDIYPNAVELLRGVYTGVDIDDVSEEEDEHIEDMLGYNDEDEDEEGDDDEEGGDDDEEGGDDDEEGDEEEVEDDE
eukprot:1733894-Pyramimonas_sp.AAC.1